MTIVLALDDNTIYDHDVQSLQPGGWLTDSMIDYGIRELYYHVPSPLNETICPLYASTATLCTYAVGEDLSPFLESFHLSKQEIVFIPVIRMTGTQSLYSPGNGVHWSLLIFLRKASMFPKIFFNNSRISKPSKLSANDPVFLHFDSSQQSNLQAAHDFMAKISIHLKYGTKLADIIPMPSPQQPNSSDCGVYLIFFASLPLSFSVIHFKIICRLFS